MQFKYLYTVHHGLVGHHCLHWLPGLGSEHPASIITAPSLSTAPGTRWRRCKEPHQAEHHHHRRGSCHKGCRPHRVTTATTHHDAGLSGGLEGLAAWRSISLSSPDPQDWKRADRGVARIAIASSRISTDYRRDDDEELPTNERPSNSREIRSGSSASNRQSNPRGEGRHQ